jgi:hypothetical protein
MPGPSSKVPPHCAPVLASSPLRGRRRSQTRRRANGGGHGGAFVTVSRVRSRPTWTRPSWTPAPSWCPVSSDLEQSASTKQDWKCVHPAVTDACPNPPPHPVRIAGGITLECRPRPGPSRSSVSMTTRCPIGTSTHHCAVEETPIDPASSGPDQCPSDLPSASAMAMAAIPTR